MIQVGIIGCGFVGKATGLFKGDNINISKYDINSELCVPESITLEQISKNSDILFICLPTPMKSDGSCHLGIIENVLNEMKTYVDLNDKIVVLRSTVPVGTAKQFNCYFMPEFLTEKNSDEDFKNTACWILGLKDEQTHAKQNEKAKSIFNFIIQENYFSNNIKSQERKYMNTCEAEALKLFKNTFLATKVGFCNEFYSFCQAKNINYNTIIDGVITDERIGNTHVQVPGHDGKMGFGGTCFPKDINSLAFQMKQNNVKMPIIENVIFRNNTIDRPEQDWNSDKGRAVV